MKLQLDTTNKTIKMENNVNLKELFDILEKMLPNNLWQEFTLEANVTINWTTSPYIIERGAYPAHPYYPADPYPWTIWCGDYSSDTHTNASPQYTSTSSTYNIEVK